jgi:DNA replicative helicase MCM subunit Mcm2 (Cdc46/Mcm family)
MFIEIIKNKYENHHIKIINLPKDNNVNIEDIRKEHIDKLICVDGRVASIGQVRPVCKSIKFECPSCGTVFSVFQDYKSGKIRSPSRCSCGRRGGFRELSRDEYNASFLQLEDLQEKTDNPHSQRIKAIISNSNCDKDKIQTYMPGNEIKCVGILRRIPKYKGNEELIVSDWIIDIISSEQIEKEIDINQFNDSDVEDIQILSNDINNNGLSSLINSFAPDIYGYEEIKSAIILQLCNKRNNIKSNSVRNKSNILLIGDPGVAKSVMCEFAVSITPNSRKAAGGGSSAVGITASVVKEEESLGGYRVEPGAMILAKDLLFIDELNNLQDEDKPKLQEGMNEMTISIDKANIHVKMKVTCGIIAAANPSRGVFDEEIPYNQQFNIPKPILNRFDSIFVLKDEVNENNDKLIAEKMLKRHSGKLESQYSKEFLRKFFTYIKNYPEPIINDNIADKIKNLYSDIRKINNSNVRINPRFIESLTRMSISSAKLRLDTEVKLKDISLALCILSKSQYNLSRETSFSIDFDDIIGGLI